MEKDKFNFGDAVLVVLNEWMRSNLNLMRGLNFSNNFFSWKSGELVINLNALNDGYQRKFIQPDFEKYCNQLITAVEKPIGNFLLFYGFPAVAIKIGFEYWGKSMSKDITIQPTQAVLNVVKRNKN